MGYCKSCGVFGDDEGFHQQFRQVSPPNCEALAGRFGSEGNEAISRPFSRTESRGFLREF